MESYQEKFSLSNNQMFDYESRVRKAKKAVSIISDHLLETKNCIILDIGCSTGIMANEYSKYFNEIIGIDIDKEAIKYASENFKNKNITFLTASFNESVLERGKFDVITCSHVYEQVDDAKELIDTIYNLLKPGGICYFVAGNKYKIIEPQFKLPFLSFLPKKLGRLYIKIAKKDGVFYQKHLSYFKLKKLVRKFTIYDYTIETLKNPSKYHSEDLIVDGTLKQKAFIFISNILYFLIPTYIWILRKDVI